MRSFKVRLTLQLAQSVDENVDGQGGAGVLKQLLHSVIL
jgi:hypothetical protein